MNVGQAPAPGPVLTMSSISQRRVVPPRHRRRAAACTCRRERQRLFCVGWRSARLTPRYSRVAPRTPTFACAPLTSPGPLSYLRKWPFLSVPGPVVEPGVPASGGIPFGLARTNIYSCRNFEGPQGHTVVWQALRLGMAVEVKRATDWLHPVIEPFSGFLQLNNAGSVGLPLFTQPGPLADSCSAAFPGAVRGPFRIRINRLVLGSCQRDVPQASGLTAQRECPRRAGGSKFEQA
jgi:hypothetical protein